MKNILLVLLFSLMTSVASAQFMVTSMISEPAEGAEMSLDNLTDNIGVMLITSEEEEVSLGVGYSLNIWNELYIEPSYLLDLENEDYEGELKLSLTYKL